MGIDGNAFRGVVVLAWVGIIAICLAAIAVIVGLGWLVGRLLT